MIQLTGIGDKALPVFVRYEHITGIEETEGVEETGVAHENYLVRCRRLHLHATSVLVSEEVGDILMLMRMDPDKEPGQFSKIVCKEQMKGNRFVKKEGAWSIKQG